MKTYRTVKFDEEKRQANKGSVSVTAATMAKMTATSRRWSLPMSRLLEVIINQALDRKGAP